MIWIGEGYADAEAMSPSTPIQTEASRPRADLGGASLVAITAALLLVFGGPFFQYLKAQSTIRAVAELDLPALTGCSEPGDWSPDLSPGFPDYQGADFVFRQTYACGDVRTSVYIAEYHRQEQGKELISSTNRVWPYDWRLFTDQSPVHVAAKDGTVEVQEVHIRDPERPRLAWYWYQVGRVVTASEFRVKLMEARHTLRFHPVASSVVVVVIAGERDTTLAALRDALQPRVRTVMAWNQDRAVEAR
jgi:EpsI family protein